MKNLVMALMMLLVLGAGFLLGSKYNLNDGQIYVLDLINNTSGDSNSHGYVTGDLNKSKDQNKTTNNQKNNFQQVSKPKVVNVNKNPANTNNSITEISNKENDTKSNDKNEQKPENNNT